MPDMLYKELHWILQHPAEVFPKIPEQYANTVSAVLDVILRVSNLSKSRVNNASACVASIYQTRYWLKAVSDDAGERGQPLAACLL